MSKREPGTLDLSFLLRPARMGEPEIVALGVTAAVFLGAFLMGKAINHAVNRLSGRYGLPTACDMVCNLQYLRTEG